MLHYGVKFFPSRDFGRIAFYDVGSSDKVVLCVHGITRNKHDFDVLISKLSQSYRCISLDIIGRGESDYSDRIADYNYITYCKQVITLLRYLKIDQVHYIGTSMGGIIGMYLANYYPTTISSLLLNDIGMSINSDILHTIYNLLSQHYIFHTYEQALSELKIMLDPCKIQDFQHIGRHSITRSGDQYRFAYDYKIVRRLYDDIQNLNVIDFTLLFQRISIPIMVLRGKNSKVLTQKIVNDMINVNSKLIIKEYPGFGHYPNLMSYDQISDINDWLRALC